MFLFNFVRFHRKIFFHLIVIVTLCMMDLCVCLCFFFACTSSNQTQYIHFIICLHSTRRVCVCLCVFFPSNVSNRTNWFSDRLLQFADKWFNFFFAYVWSAKLCVEYTFHTNTVMTYLNSHFVFRILLVCLLTSNHFKFTHTFENVF